MLIQTRFRPLLLGAVIGGVALLTGGTDARADGFLLNAAGDLAIGVHDEGHLNIPEPGAVPVVNASRLGLALDIPSEGGFNDATSPGCFCEGWGASASGVSMHANEDFGGATNITVDSFVDAGSSLTSTVHATSTPGFGVSQVYEVSPETDRLFRDTVTITNTTGGMLTDVRYVRVMDWDIPPDEFNEFVTIVGTGTTTLLEMSTDDGFETADPLASGDSPISGCAGALSDFVDCGPADHGAYFRFNFGDLADGESHSFDIFYGATTSESSALAALSAVGAELFSLGQYSGDPSGGTPGTFIFAFRGVGGTPVVPPPGIPEPASLSLMGLGLAAMGWIFRRRRTA